VRKNKRDNAWIVIFTSLTREKVSFEVVLFFFSEGKMKNIPIMKKVTKASFFPLSCIIESQLVIVIFEEDANMRECHPCEAFVFYSTPYTYKQSKERRGTKKHIMAFTEVVL
jgi:hypothetical protein